MGPFIIPTQKRIEKRFEHFGQQYVENNLNFFINKNKQTTRISNSGSWIIHEDRDTLLRQQLLRYILDHFNMYELYVVFFNPTFTPFRDYYLYRSRSAAIRSINEDDSFTPEEAKRLKRKVWDMHPIFFELMMEFINNSELFWDREKEAIVYPTWTFES